MKRTAWLFLIGLFLAGCGGSSGGGPPTVTISGMMFSPTVLSVVAGATINVDNRDNFAHTFTSESAENAYVPGPVGGFSFDESLPAMGTATVTVPAGTAVGTKIWFYCNIHKAAMNQGYIVVVPAGGGGY